MDEEYKINVYIDDGRVFTYPVKTESSAREHASAIVTSGYRSVTDGCFTYYPVHRVLKVTVTGGTISTKYPDTVRGT